MKNVIYLFIVGAAVCGCGADPSMSQKDVASFAPPKGVRDAKANKQIADFKAKFEATHGGATNAPAQAKAPG